MVAMVEVHTVASLAAYFQQELPFLDGNTSWRFLIEDDDVKDESGWFEGDNIGGDDYELHICSDTNFLYYTHKRMKSNWSFYIIMREDLEDDRNEGLQIVAVEQKGWRIVSKPDEAFSNDVMSIRDKLEATRKEVVRIEKADM